MKITNINFGQKTNKTTFSAQPSGQTQEQETKSDNTKIYMTLGGLAALGLGAFLFYKHKGKAPEVKTPHEKPHDTPHNPVDTGTTPHSGADATPSNADTPTTNNAPKTQDASAQQQPAAPEFIGPQKPSETKQETPSTTPQNGGGTELPTPKAEQNIDVPQIAETKLKLVKNPGLRRISVNGKRFLRQKLRHPQPISTEAKAVPDKLERHPLNRLKKWWQNRQQTAKTAEVQAPQVIEAPVAEVKKVTKKPRKRTINRKINAKRQKQSKAPQQAPNQPQTAVVAQTPKRAKKSAQKPVEQAPQAPEPTLKPEKKGIIASIKDAAHKIFPPKPEVYGPPKPKHLSAKPEVKAEPKAAEQAPQLPAPTLQPAKKGLMVSIKEVANKIMPQKPEVYGPPKPKHLSAKPEAKAEPKIEVKPELEVYGPPEMYGPPKPEHLKEPQEEIFELPEKIGGGILIKMAELFGVKEKPLKEPQMQDNVAFWKNYWDFSKPVELPQKLEKEITKEPSNLVDAKLLDKPKMPVTPKNPTPKQKQEFWQEYFNPQKKSLVQKFLKNWNEFWGTHEKPAAAPKAPEIARLEPHTTPQKPKKAALKKQAGPRTNTTQTPAPMPKKAPKAPERKPFIPSPLGSQIDFMQSLEPKMASALAVLEKTPQEKANLEQLAIMFDFDRRTPKATDHLIPNAIAIVGDDFAKVETVVNNLPQITETPLTETKKKFAPKIFKELNQIKKEAKAKFDATGERTLVYVGDIHHLTVNKLNMKDHENQMAALQHILGDCAEEQGITLVYRARTENEIPKGIETALHTGFVLKTQPKAKQQ